VEEKLMAKKREKAPAEDPEMVRMYLAPGESGWAELVGPRTVRIANIPFSGELNIDDIVRVRRGPHGMIEPVRVMERVFPVRTTIWYPRADQFRQVQELVKKAGGKGEGAVGPSKDRPGAVSVALPAEGIAEEIYEKIRFAPPEDWAPNQITIDPRDWSPGR
jgi:hypothetical protein